MPSRFVLVVLCGMAGVLSAAAAHAQPGEVWVLRTPQRAAPAALAAELGSLGGGGGRDDPHGPRGWRHQRGRGGWTAVRRAVGRRPSSARSAAASLLRSHPYARAALDQTIPAWDAKFGSFDRTAPVIVTEWSTGYYCDSNTPASVVSFLHYLQAHEIGLETATWDWSPAHFGSAVYNFPVSAFSSFIGLSGPLSCKDAGCGFGKTVEVWYRTGVPPASIR